MSYRPYPGSMASIYDLAHLATLSDVPGLTLFVSPRTLYVLQNFALAEATRQDRYASELVQNGYFSVEEGDPSFGLFLSVTDAIELEVMQVMDVIDKLDEILVRLDDLLLAGSHGLYLSEWVEDTPRFGYGGQRGSQVLNLNASAGVNYLYSGTVPAGEVWTVENMAAVNSNSALATIGIFAEYDGALHILAEHYSVGAGEWRTWGGKLSLGPGDRVGCYFNACVAGDDIVLRIYAHRTAGI